MTWVLFRRLSMHRPPPCRGLSSAASPNLSIRLTRQSNLQLSAVTLQEHLDDPTAVAVKFVTTHCDNPGDLHAGQFARFSKTKNTFALLDDDKKRMGFQALVGLGEPKDVSEDTVKEATNALMKHLVAHDIPRADVFLPTSVVASSAMMMMADDRRLLQIMAQVMMLSNYHFDKYRTTQTRQDEGRRRVEHIRFVLPTLDAAKDVEMTLNEQRVVAEETLFARDCGNERSDVMTPAYFEDLARRTVRELQPVAEDRISLCVLDQDELKTTGLNLLSAVGQGAVCPPRLVILEYTPPPTTSNIKKIALVGKGVTFDTGGLNLKPTNFIEDMHMDMCGAAAVLGAFRSAVRLQSPVPLVAAFPLAENALDAHAVKPRAIVTSLDGRSVEIANTDAEGRLILADALTYVQRTCRPDIVVDVATLTGACVVALGTTTAGVFGNSRRLAEALVDAGRKVGETAWRLPILKEHRAAIIAKSDTTQADLRSTGATRYGGACTAAAFLEQFILSTRCDDKETVEWAHLDIAGPASRETARSYLPEGATGYGVQLLYTYLKDQARDWTAETDDHRSSKPSS